MWYGTSTGIYTASTTSADLVSSHSIGLNDLSPSTTYYFIVVSSNGQTATSWEMSFQTDSVPVVLPSPSVSESRGSIILPYVPASIVAPRIQTQNTVVNTPANVAPSCSLSIYPTKPIRIGKQNDPVQVKLLEQFLNQFENANLPVDGVYSLTDESAVKVWQEKYANEILKPWGEIQGTGYVFITSLTKIKSIFDGQCSKVNINDITTTITDVRDLYLGMAGNDVHALQSILITQGYSIPAGATGFFANQTKSALTKYQSDHNISPAVGYFGVTTRA